MKEKGFMKLNDSALNLKFDVLNRKVMLVDFIVCGVTKESSYGNRKRKQLNC